MEWWLIVLIFLACIAAGVVVGALISYLILRFVKKRETGPWFGRRREVVTVGKPTMPLASKPVVAPAPPPAPVAEKEAEEQVEQVASPPAPVAEKEAEEQAKQAAPQLLDEVKQNLKLANEALQDKILAFQTQVWDAHQYEADNLPVALREDLEQVYTDIRLANSLAWLSSEFSRRTPSLNENYMRLRTNIVERLERVKQQMEQETGGK